jgi:FkbM family methyltransferase
LRNHHYDFTFHCSRIDIDWSASAFPDILTRHMLFEGMYQEDVLVALRSTVRPGDTVFDVGGHHGLMAVIGARATGPRGRVVSFEPNPASRKQIERHAQLNGVTNIRIEPIALSDRNGEHEFFVQSGDVSWNSTLIKAFADAENTPGRRIEKISVATCRLDDYVARSGCVPKVIKIDTEGSEFMVLRGALDTIERHRPVLIMEFNPASAASAHTTIEEYVDLLQRLSYRLRVLRRTVLGYYKFALQEPFDVRRHAIASLVNVICMPEERDGV